jgi:hypothetical protein
MAGSVGLDAAPTTIKILFAGTLSYAACHTPRPMLPDAPLKQAFASIPSTWLCLLFCFLGLLQ